MVTDNVDDTDNAVLVNDSHLRFDAVKAPFLDSDIIMRVVD